MLKFKSLKSLKKIIIIQKRSVSKIPKIENNKSPFDPTEDAINLRHRNFNQINSKTHLLMPEIVEEHVPPTELGKLNGYPENYQGRHAIIYRYQNSQQFSGKKGRYWSLKFDKIGAEKQGLDFLTGNSQLTDPLSTVNMKFNSIEEAITFCERNGISHEVELPPESVDVVQDFGFKVFPKRVREELKVLGKVKGASVFYYPKPFNDHWINRYHSDYGNEKWSNQ